MANNKKSTIKTSSTTTTKSSFFSLNKLSMWTIIAVAVLYVISLVLSAVGINLKIVSACQGVATAFMISIVAILAWRHVKHKSWVWILLYVICLLLVVVGVIVPLVI